MLIQVLVVFMWLALLNRGAECKYGVYTECDTEKHCIECLQMEMNWGRHYMVPNPHIYKQMLQLTVNEYRNKYAKMFGIGNMRYAEWNKVLYELCVNLTSKTGDTRFICLTGAKSPNIPTRFNHDIVDVDSSVEIIVNRNSTDVFDEQFKILLNKILKVGHVTDYNMDEFGCDYSFRPENNLTAFLLRCIFYTNSDYDGEGEIYSVAPCSDCSLTESCSYEHPWLCEKNKI